MFLILQHSSVWLQKGNEGIFVYTLANPVMRKFQIEEYLVSTVPVGSTY
jgi:hypothetical protein